MVSNDLFRDLKDEDEAFKEAMKDSLNLFLFQIKTETSIHDIYDYDATMYDEAGNMSIVVVG